MSWYEEFFAGSLWGDVQRTRYTPESAWRIAEA